MKNNTKIIIIGAGASGVGVGVVLKELGINDYLILDKGNVGESFSNWANETRLISPSFTSNMFNIPDLNSVTPLTSPAFNFNKEHLSGADYAKYLKLVTEHYKLNVIKNVEVVEINKEKGRFVVVSKDQSVYTSDYLIWAGGEFSNKRNVFDNVPHTATIKSYAKVADTDKGDEFFVIGGGESAFDFAINLASNGKKVRVFTQSDFESELDGDDPSKKISPVTYQKYLEVKDMVKVTSKVRVVDIKQETDNEENSFTIILEGGKKFQTKNLPYQATGFDKLPVLVANFVDLLPSGDLDLNNFDESRKTKGMFFVGPFVHRKNVILCFIYKFRMRFAVVALQVAKSLKTDKQTVEKVKKHYKKYNMYLEDISSCDINCEC